MDQFGHRGHHLIACPHARGLLKLSEARVYIRKRAAPFFPNMSFVAVIEIAFHNRIFPSYEHKSFRLPNPPPSTSSSPFSRLCLKPRLRRLSYLLRCIVVTYLYLIQNLSWEQIATAIGRDEVWVASVFYGQVCPLSSPYLGARKVKNVWQY